MFDSFGSPTIQPDLTTFDTAYNIPAPPSFSVYRPEGNVTYRYVGASASAVKANKNFQNEINWGYETTLDVERAHAMAPGANIALVETPVAETQGAQDCGTCRTPSSGCSTITSGRFGRTATRPPSRRSTTTR
jgi:subtilase family serine protease